MIPRNWTSFMDTCGAAKLDLNPQMPAELRGRSPDNWRPLIAIADSCGKGWPDLARAAAINLSEHQEEDAAVLLLRDIRTVFDAQRVDRLTSKVLVEHLADLDDAGWDEWRGLR